MTDFYAKHIIEALRSGVPSRAVGAYFSEARPDMTRRINAKLEGVTESGRSDGMIFLGRYGEGKTHLLNSVFSHATNANMVVSLIPLGKETPIDKIYRLYPKLMANTWLPKSSQPGITKIFEEMTQNSSLAAEMSAYAAKELETDKLYYLLRAYLGTNSDDEKYMFLSDFEGDFAPPAVIKKSYKRIYGSTVKFNVPFSKTKHAMDYFYFMSHLFRLKGYDGWVILFDEAELIGRFGKKARAKSYLEMSRFLKPDPRLTDTFSLFAFSASYIEDVIDKKQDIPNVAELFSEDNDQLTAANYTITQIEKAPELAPLSREEIEQILLSLQDFHGKAYDWTPSISKDTLYSVASGGGYLLRTKIRIAIEFLDQLYQYGEAGDTKITGLGKESFEEDVPEIPE